MLSHLLFGLWVGCSGIQRIPAPAPKSSSLPPSQARAYYLRGQLRMAKGELDSAEYAFERARIFDPQSAQILMALSRVSLNRSDVSEATSRMKAAADFSDDDPVPWLEYGRLELAFGDKAAGEAALERAHMLGDPWQAKAALISFAIRSNRPTPLLDTWAARPEPDPIALRRRAGLRADAGDHRGAVDDFLVLLATTPRDLSLVSPFVESAARGGRIASGLLAAEAITLDMPGASAAWMSVGLLSVLIHDHVSVVSALETAQNLGVVLGPGPLSALTESMAPKVNANMAPPGMTAAPDDLFNRAQALIAAKDWDEGERLLHAALRTAPKDPRLLYILTDLHLKRDGIDAAALLVDEMLAFHPKFGPGLNLWAWIQSERGTRLDEAAVAVMAALDGQPGLGSYWDTLGWITHLQGQHGLAQTTLSRAHHLSPKDDSILAHLKLCQREDGVNPQ